MHLELTINPRTVFAKLRQKYPAVMKIAGYLIQLLLLVAVVIIVDRWQSRDHLTGGSELPGVSFTTYRGDTVSLQSFKGKKTALYFFAPWCTVCKLNIKNMNVFHGKNEIQAFAIALDYQSKDEVKRMVKGLKVPVLFSTSDAIRKFKISGFPTIYFLSEDLKILSSTMGYTTEVSMLMRSL